MILARLSEDGIAVVDVPAKLAARLRLLSTGHGRKAMPLMPGSAWKARADSL